MTLKELLARLGEIRTEAQALVDAADADHEGQMTEEQTAQFDALMEERKQVEANIDRRQQLDDMSQSTGRRTPAATAHDNRQDDPTAGFSNLAEFALAVRAVDHRGGGRIDERLQVLGAPTDFHRETGSTDGYQVPPAMRDEIFELVFADEGILASVNPEPTESNAVQMNGDESTPWGSTGIQARWASEGSQFDPSRLTTDARTVLLHKLYAFVLATDELLEDAARLNSRLTRQSAQAINFKAGEAIVEGDGVGKPLGWFNSGALITVAKESGQSAATIVAANVLKMFSQLRNPMGAYWLVNQNTVPQLAVMTIGDQPIWTPPSTGLQNAPGGLLLGLPIRFSEFAETLGTKGDIQLVQPRGYYAAVKAAGIKFAASMHLYFDYDIEAFRWTFRLGGQPFLTAPVTPNKGDTKSDFITLATRS